MERKCKIYCKGNHLVPDVWINTVASNMNRLIYIKSGKGEYLENGVMYPLEAGRMYFIPSYSGGVPTYTGTVDRIDHAYLNFFLTPPIVSRKVFSLDPYSSPKLKNALEAWCELCKGSFNSRLQPYPTAPETVRDFELLKSLTVYLAETAVKDSPESVINDPNIATALEIMHNSLSEKLTVAQIAEKCYMSTDGFIRKFKHYLGETPYSYLKKLKLATAEYLRYEGATLEEAAEKCGYSDASALLHAIASYRHAPAGNIRR